MNPTVSVTKAKDIDSGDQMCDEKDIVAIDVKLV